MANYGQQTSRRQLTEALKEALLDEAGGRCADPFGGCALRDRRLLRSGITGAWLVDFDHIMPWSVGGRSTFKNLQVLCPTCHADKTRSLDNGSNRRRKSLLQTWKRRRCDGLAVDRWMG